MNYTYDKAGNRLSMSSSSATITYRYDPRNRLTNETDVIGTRTFTILYTYDKVGNIMTLAYPDNYIQSFAYDPFNRVKTVGSFATFTYTLDDKIKTISFGNGVLSTYTYNAMSRPTRLLTTSGSTKLFDQNYTYDNAGNLIYVKSMSSTYNYTYDALNRLTTSVGPWGTITYT